MISKDADVSIRRNSFVRLHPVATYFLLTFGLSWTGSLVVIGPSLLRGEKVPQISGLLVFPVLILGPCIAGIVVTGFVGGRPSLRALFLSMRQFRVPIGWYAALLIPPALILTILKVFQAAVSPSFAPNLFIPGLAFGVIAGFVEETGWTGFVFPAMLRNHSAVWCALVLGLLWGTWHAPAIDYLGTATPHGSYWLEYFLMFGAAMMAIRVLISWLYQNTKSLLLAQLMHTSSTASLVVFSPGRVTAAQEAHWYGAYALCLWAIAATVIVTCGKDLKCRSASPSRPQSPAP